MQNLLQSDCILDQEKATYKELDELLQREQILRKDKAKECWLTDGDANTRYFHLSTIAHQRQNHIDHIFTEIGQRKTGQDDIGDLFVDFYNKLFNSESHIFPDDLQGLITKLVEEYANVQLMICPSVQEVKEAVFSMSGSKSSGPDGMNSTFFKHLWGITGEIVISVVQSYFRGGSVSRAANHTFITLIPKRK